jgi:hypothetical protein
MGRDLLTMTTFIILINDNGFLDEFKKSNFFIGMFFNDRLIVFQISYNFIII